MTYKPSNGDFILISAIDGAICHATDKNQLREVVDAMLAIDPVLWPWIIRDATSSLDSDQWCDFVAGLLKDYGSPRGDRR